MFVIKLKCEQLLQLGIMYEKFYNFKIPNINIATYFLKTYSNTNFTGKAILRNTAPHTMELGADLG